MNLLPWRRDSQVSPFQQFHREMDQLMQRFFGDADLETTSKQMASWTPRVDVEEDDKQYLVKVDLPGVDPKEVDISVHENALVIRGQRKEEKEEKKKNYHRVERFTGEFYREIALPRGIDAEKIQAKSANGVISITIPKKAESQPKRVAIQA
ncbi:MAG TPA: Hsp20/alpha crystallin family protein [Gemmatales bacterium]|nr:Hsp20/alpha crystallin family protein [Gemmatales bacterium]